jgi:hypothetical protein
VSDARMYEEISLTGALTGRRESDIDSMAYATIVLSVGIILTTIHTQDYKDASGDAAAGRVTHPTLKNHLEQ